MDGKEKTVSKDSFFTKEDYDTFSLQSDLSQYLQNFIPNSIQQHSKEGHQKQENNITQEYRDARVILEEVNRSAQSDTGVNIQYPRLSYISIEEQKALMEKYEKELKGIIDGSWEYNNPIASMKELKTRVISEQQEFQHFAYQHVRNNIEVLNAVPEGIKKLIQASQLLKTKQIKEYFEQFYNLQQTIGLSVGAHFKNNPWLEFQEILLQTGDVPKIEKPTERFNISFDNMVKSVTQQDNTTQDLHLPLHKDPAALSLAQEHKAHIVTTSSCLTTLFDNEQHDQAWDIPVVILQPDDTVKDTDVHKEKIVFLEKPLPKRAYTPQQIMRSVYKRAVIKHLKTGEEKPVKNFVYSLWKFGKFTVLIRCKLDAYITDDEKHLQTFLSVVAKPEYFSYFGYERFSANETAKWWLKSSIRPNTFVLCARIDTKSHEVLRLDELNPADVLSCGSAFNPGQRMKTIYQVLSILSEVQCDSYVLSHQNGSPHCCLYRKSLQSVTAKKPDIDLYARCNEPISIRLFNNTNIPWSGVDTEIFLTYQTQQKRIPATFPAVPNSVLQHISKKAEIQWKPNVSRGQKKKKKKKKARQQRNSKPSNYHNVPPVVSQDSTPASTSRSRGRNRLRRYHDFDAMS